MESCIEDERSTSTSLSHQFTFKNRLCIFCASPLDWQRDQRIDSSTDWSSSLNENIFKDGVTILCETLNLSGSLDELFGVDGIDNWRLLGIDNFVQCICCESCYQLISELVSLHQLIVQSQNSLKENARKLESFVVSSQESEPSLEYSLNACVLLRQNILNNVNIHDHHSWTQPEGKHEITLKSKPRPCPKQPIVLLNRLKLSPPSPIKQDIAPIPIPSPEIYDEDYICPSPSPPEVIETDEDFKDNEDDQDYRPVKRSRRSTGRKRGRPKILKPPKNRGKPGRPRKRNQDHTQLAQPEIVKAKRKRITKPTSYQIKEDKLKLEINEDIKPTTTSSNKGGRPRHLPLGNRQHLQLEGTGQKLHAIYFLSSSSSPEGILDYLMMYNVKFCKTATYLQCLHPDCSHKETLTGYFTDQTLLRNIRFHIRFAHRSPPKKDNPEENKPSFYYCHLCDSQIDSKIGFLEHRRQLHQEEGDQGPSICFCDVCGDPGVPSGDLIDHVFSHKSKHEKDVISEQLKRKRVGKNKDILKPLLHPCDQCDKHFKCHTELMTHRNIHLPLVLKAKVVCEICGKGSRNATQLEIHKRRVHWRNLPVEYECHICGRGFFKCQKDRWMEHLNVHTGERPYQCEQCGKGFIGKEHLSRHVKVMHAVGGRAGFRCEFCGKVYKEDKYLRKHCLRDHPDKVESKEEDKVKYLSLENRHDFIGPKLMFPCEPCGKVFIFRSVLITHLKNRHKMFYERKEDYPWQLTLEDKFGMETGS